MNGDVAADGPVARLNPDAPRGCYIRPRQAFIIQATSSEQIAIMPTDSPSDLQLAQEANANVNRLRPPLFPPNAHPDAQWFPEAGLGLFMHWGIHSVASAQPSWCMMDRCPFSGPRIAAEDYYALAERFDPRAYDPDLWLEAAARAGFRYAVLTTKHHDGYTLWPSEATRYGTHSHLDGRDLLAPYVRACRKHGLKVGFYFSQRDWSYEGFPMGEPAFDYPTYKGRQGGDQAGFDRFFDYTMVQVRELMTRYGQIDVLWFDGCDWPGVDDRHLEARQEVRSLMPGVVMNERWGEGNTGDFSTWECKEPPDRPIGWWEADSIWDGHWGYNHGRPLKPVSRVLNDLTRTRGWGGNCLINIGPAPDGTMKRGFYRRCEELEEWMTRHAESIHGARGLPESCHSNVPITTRDNAWYVHLPSDHGEVDEIEIDGMPSRPTAATNLRDGTELPFEWDGCKLTITLDAKFRRLFRPTCEVDVIKLSLA